MIKKAVLITIFVLPITLIIILNPGKKPVSNETYNSPGNPAAVESDDDEDSIHVKNVFLMNIKHIIKFFRI